MTLRLSANGVASADLHWLIDCDEELSDEQVLVEARPRQRSARLQRQWKFLDMCRSGAEQAVRERPRARACAAQPGERRLPPSGALDVLGAPRLRVAHVLQDDGARGYVGVGGRCVGARDRRAQSDTLARQGAICLVVMWVRLVKPLAPLGAKRRGVQHSASATRPTL